MVIVSLVLLMNPLQMPEKHKKFKIPIKEIVLDNKTAN